ncbi:MAG: GNAT family N-acetyltransferase [Candidatus Eremiobacteraeota bacterium]|nr:GNAT family N-acetyltransferase [Candidatus Eremiobacteraeota bacterium]
MAGAERIDAFTLMKQFRADEALLGEALALYVDRPDYGFIWLAYEDGIPAACVSAAYAISTESGGLAASLRDLWVVPDRRRRGIGSALLATLHGRVDQLAITRVEASLPNDPALRAFFAARGYADLGGTTVASIRR